MIGAAVLSIHVFLQVLDGASFTGNLWTWVISGDLQVPVGLLIDRLTKQWIIDHQAAQPAQPFFMYLAFDTPHAVLELPTQAYPEGGGLTGGLQWLGTPGNMCR